MGTWSMGMKELLWWNMSPMEPLENTWSAMKKFSDGNAILILDPRLERSPVNILALEKILELALQCLAPHRKNQSRMRRCAEILWSIRKDYRDIVASNIHALSPDSQRSILVREE